MEMGLVSSTLLGKMDSRYRSMVIDKDEWKRRDFQRCIIFTVRIRHINELLSCWKIINFRNLRLTYLAYEKICLETALIDFIDFKLRKSGNNTNINCFLFLLILKSGQYRLID